MFELLMEKNRVRKMGPLQVVRFGNSKDVTAGWKAGGRGPGERVSAYVAGCDIQI